MAETHQQQFQAQLGACAQAVAEESDADVLLYSGRVDTPSDDIVLDRVKQFGNGTRILVLLSTYGGSPDAAYRIARFLQHRYQKFTVFVYGYCKSAGTLIALGADELVVSDYGELGPLDVQLRKVDELGEQSSGLAIMDALTTLRQKAFDGFVDHFVSAKMELEMSAKTAAEVATAMSVGLFKEIYSQIDPIRLGEIARAINIASEYGERLTKARNNVKQGALAKLVSQYPSHGFVIDRREAATLFNVVRAPTEKEERLAELIKIVARTPFDGKDPAVLCFPRRQSHEQLTSQPDSQAEPRGGAQDGGPGASARGGKDGSDHGDSEAGATGSADASA